MDFWKLQKRGADPMAIESRLWDECPYVFGSLDDEPEPHADADYVCGVIAQVWRPGMSEEQWLRAVKLALDVE